MLKVLIMGFGKMGQIYGRYLDEMGVTFDIYDPNLCSNILPMYFKQYSHIIISSPTSTHMTNYQWIRNRCPDYSGQILIEKPVTMEREFLPHLRDVSAGMCERFNEATSKIKSLLQVRKPWSVQIIRTQPGCINPFDLGIHAIDLAIELFGNDITLNGIQRYKNLMLVDFTMGDTSVALEFGNGLKNERKIFIDGMIAADYTKDKPIGKQLEYFLAGNRVDAYRSHEVMFKLTNIVGEKL